MKPKDFLSSVILIAALSAFGISSGVASDKNEAKHSNKITKARAERVALTKVPGGSIRSAELETARGQRFGSVYVLVRLGELLRYPPRHRMPALLLFGATGMGKTRIMNDFSGETTPTLMRYAYYPTSGGGFADAAHSARARFLRGIVGDYGSGITGGAEFDQSARAGTGSAVGGTHARHRRDPRLAAARRNDADRR